MKRWLLSMLIATLVATGAPGCGARLGAWKLEHDVMSPWIRSPDGRLALRWEAVIHGPGGGRGGDIVPHMYENASICLRTLLRTPIGERRLVDALLSTGCDDESEISWTTASLTRRATTWLRRAAAKWSPNERGIVAIKRPGDVRWHAFCAEPPARFLRFVGDGTTPRFPIDATRLTLEDTQREAIDAKEIERGVAALPIVNEVVVIEEPSPYESALIRIIATSKDGSVTRNGSSDLKRMYEASPAYGVLSSFVQQKISNYEIRPAFPRLPDGAIDREAIFKEFHRCVAL